MRSFYGLILSLREANDAGKVDELIKLFPDKF